MNTSTIDQISVSGMCKYDQETEYRVKIIIGLDNLTYEDGENFGFQDLKDMFMSKLVDSGIAGTDVCEITEDPFEFALMNYIQEGTILYCKTKSLKIVEKLMNVKSEGVFKQDISWQPKLSKEDMSQYFNLAFNDAKTRAQSIAESMGRTIGRALSIEDYNLSDGYREIIYTTDILNRKEYHVKVSFEMI